MLQGCREHLDGLRSTSDPCQLSDLTCPPQAALPGSGCQIPQTAAASSRAENQDARLVLSEWIEQINKQLFRMLSSVSASPFLLQVSGQVHRVEMVGYNFLSFFLSSLCQSQLFH